MKQGSINILGIWCHTVAVVCAAIALIISLVLPHFLFVLTDSHLEVTTHLVGTEFSTDPRHEVILSYSLHGKNIYREEDIPASPLPSLVWHADSNVYQAIMTEHIEIPDVAVFGTYTLDVTTRYLTEQQTETFELTVLPRVLYVILSSTFVKVLLVISLLCSVLGAASSWRARRQGIV